MSFLSNEIHNIFFQVTDEYCKYLLNAEITVEWLLPGRFLQYNSKRTSSTKLEIQKVHEYMSRALICTRMTWVNALIEDPLTHNIDILRLG